MPLVTTTGNNAFRDCDLLVTVTASNITEFGVSTFRDCSELVTVNVPVLETIGSSCFQSCGKLTTYNGGAEITIKDASFSGTGITSFSSDTLLTIGELSFKDCNNLESFIATSLTDVSNDAFNGSGKLNNFEAPVLQTLGDDLTDNSVFSNIPIQPTVNCVFEVPISFMTADNGNPEGDINVLLNLGWNPRYGNNIQFDIDTTLDATTDEFIFPVSGNVDIKIDWGMVHL